MPTAETLQNEAIVVLQLALPVLTENDLPPARSIGDPLQTHFQTGILDIRFDEAILLEIGNLIRDGALAYWNDAFLPARSTDFITSCYGTSDALLDCLPPLPSDPLIQKVSRDITLRAEMRIGGTTTAVNVQGNISFDVFYDFKGGFFEVSYSIEISIPDQTVTVNGISTELKDNPPQTVSRTRWFRKSVPAAQPIKDLITQSIQTKIENVARGPVEDCYKRECKLDTKVSCDGAVWSWVAFRCWLLCGQALMAFLFCINYPPLPIFVWI